MTDTSNETKQPGQSSMRDLLTSLVINAGIPLLIIYLMMNYAHATEIVALSVASIVPILYSILEIIRHRRLDLIGILFLLGVVTSIAAIFLGGSARLLIIRESFYTGALGIFCFISLFFMPRPLMFYIGRQMLAGKDPVKIKTFNASWQDPYIRSANRTITTVWGCVFVCEFILRVIIAFTLPVISAYGVGTTIFIIALAGTFAWTFAYIRRVRQHTQAQQGMEIRA